MTEAFDDEVSVAVDNYHHNPIRYPHHPSTFQLRNALEWSPHDRLKTLCSFVNKPDETVSEIQVAFYEKILENVAASMDLITDPSHVANRVNHARLKSIYDNAGNVPGRLSDRIQTLKEFHDNTPHRVMTTVCGWARGDRTGARELEELAKFRPLKQLFPSEMAFAAEFDDLAVAAVVLPDELPDARYVHPVSIWPTWKILRTKASEFSERLLAPTSSACATPGCANLACAAGRCLGMDCPSGLCSACFGQREYMHCCARCEGGMTGGYMTVNTAPPAVVLVMWSVADEAKREVKEYMRTAAGEPCRIDNYSGRKNKRDNIQRTSYYVSYSKLEDGSRAASKRVQYETLITAKHGSAQGRMHRQVTERSSGSIVYPKLDTGTVKQVFEIANIAKAGAETGTTVLYIKKE